MDEKTIVKLTSEQVVKEIDSVEVVDEVEIYFDWLIPPQLNGRIIFQAHITRGGRTSAVDFEIDLGRLSGVELEQLHGFLARRHAGLTDGYEMTRGVVWLLDRSLAQQRPELDKSARDSQVRELLLSHSLAK
jgi:hypothetical protein